MLGHDKTRTVVSGLDYGLGCGLTNIYTLCHALNINFTLYGIKHESTIMVHGSAIMLSMVQARQGLAD